MSGKRKTKLVWLPALAVVVAAGGVFGHREWTSWRLRRSLHADDPRKVQQTCYDIADTQATRFVDDLIDLLARSSHDDVREAAGYAIQKIGDARGVRPLLEAIERQDDDIIRAKLICYYGRLANERAEPRLREWLADPQPWRSAGAAVALLERGHAGAADVLLDRADCDESQRRQFCADELTRFTAPMAEMVGQALDLSTDGLHGFSDEQIAALRAWWRGPQTPRLLDDHLAWHHEKNPRWRLIKRMLHARERAEGWVGLKE